MVAGPNISVNKLAEYILSKGARQRQLLYQRKYPDPDFSVGMFHKESSDACSKYISEGAIDPSILVKQIAILSQLNPTKIGTARRVNSNIDALERFSEMLDDVDLMGATPHLGANTKVPKLRIHGVDISVRPEITLHGEGPKAKKLVGGLKFHFPVTHPMDEEMAGYVSAITQEWCKDFLATGDELVHAPYCQVFDIASKTVYPGIKATVQRMKDVTAECQNIAALWPTI